MEVIYRGMRYVILKEDTEGVWLRAKIESASDREVYVLRSDRDLILSPTAADVEIAEAFERGEISAFEYADGRTFPPNAEIRRTRTKPDTVH